MQLVGKQLGSYQVLEKIGGGGMGEVYRAVDRRINRQVALKVIRIEKLLSPNLAEAQEANRLFRREAEAVSKLDHSHILTLHHYDEVETQSTRLLYFVMPLCLDGSLQNWLKQRSAGPVLLPGEVAPLLDQAASALQHAHDRNILHLDVKPANFLLRGQGNSNTPELVLADFGIAKIMNTTTSGGIRGTPSFMAPEQWDGLPVPATDQYALAIMVYGLLTGSLPFRGDQQLNYQHHYSSPKPPSTLNPAISQEIDAIILRALEKSPEDRFPSVADFSRAFQKALHNNEVSPSEEVLNRISRIRPRTYIKLAISLSAAFGLGLYALSLFNISTVIPILGLVLTTISWGLGIAQTAYFQQWNWFVGILVLSPLAGIFYGIFGRTRKPYSSKISPLVRIYNDKQSKARSHLITAVIIALSIAALGNGVYTSFSVNNVIFNNTAQRMESAYATFTRNNPTQYYSLINNAGDNKWEERKGCTFAANAYEVSNDLPYNGPSQLDINPCFLQSSTFSNFVFQVQMKILAGDAGGILFRDSGGNGGGLFYFLEITQEGRYDLSFYLNRQGNSSYSVMNGYPQSLNAGLGQENTIAIVARRNELDLFLNGNFIDSQSDSGSENGLFALVAENTGYLNSSVVVFSNVKIWQL